MLARHSGIYLFSRGVPALINFLTIGVFTRILTPDEYGRYAIALAWSLLLATTGFDWLRLCILRMLPTQDDSGYAFLSLVLSTYIAIAATVILAGTLGALAVGSVQFALIAVTASLYGFHEMTGEIARSRLRPLDYGRLLLTRNVGALVFGAGLVAAGFGADGALAGLVLALLLSGLVGRSTMWRGVNGQVIQRAAIRPLLAYGLPLSASLLLHYCLMMTDRVLVDLLLGAESAGLYSVAVDLPRQSLGTLLMIVTLAGLPLAIREMERSGVASAGSQLRNNGSLLALVGLPSAAVMVLMAEPIAAAVVGPSFRESASELIPLITGAVLLQGIKTFYVDHVFILTKRVRAQLPAAATGLLLSVLLNLLLVPSFGLRGAGIAALVANAVALSLSVALARRQFPLQVPRDFWRILLATLALSASIAITPAASGAWGLALRLVPGALAYAAACVALDVAGLRGTVTTWIRRRNGERRAE